MAAVKSDQGKAPVVEGFMHYFPRAMMSVATVSEMGAKKYKVSLGDKNWMGLETNRLLNADGRHLLGEAIDGMYDPESGLLHAAHHAWEAMARLEKLLVEGVPDAVPPLLSQKFYQDDDDGLFPSLKVGDTVLVPHRFYPKDKTETAKVVALTPDYIIVIQAGSLHAHCCDSVSRVICI